MKVNYGRRLRSTLCKLGKYDNFRGAKFDCLLIWYMNLTASVTSLNTRNLLRKKKKLGEHDYAKKKSHLLLSRKRMNRYLLDVRLCKHKKIVGGVYSIFRAYEAQNLDILGYNSRVKREILTSVCGYFHSPFFLNSFI